ncbi:DUF6090 family protein [Robiginitalea sp. IMCC44478]|uniref:DUF6090 family protein n=1 Tax=Robiginitalea sp. IMCC44478 TaxID=3459122 RepID=UPI00404127D3
MLNFLRKIRQKLLRENKFRRYFLYALGEILLVVIGILIALQVNNWNEYRKDRATEEKILNAILEDLAVNRARLKNDISLEERTIRQARRIINHLDDRKPYDPSLDVVFAEALYSPDIIILSSGYEALKDKGIDLIQNEPLQKKIYALFDVAYVHLIAETVRLENQFWPSSVLPMVHKHFRETEFRKLTPTNYNALMEDTTYKNMVMHRVHFRHLSRDLKSQALRDTEELIEMIKSELGQ